MAGLGAIRQWCETCQEATESWHDNGVTRCLKHDSPATREALEDWLDIIEVIE